MARKKSKLERCILKVKKRMPKICEKRGFPRSTKYRGKKIKCYNPWAVCRASLKKK